MCLDPVKRCHRIGNVRGWERLPDEKSLFRSTPGCGLPIGDLTSQLFSNVYLNELDHFVTEGLGYRHYGRYVDDFYVVASTKEELRAIVPKVREFLLERLGLRLNEDKTLIRSAYMGVAFLGAYVKPFRAYVSNTTRSRMLKKVERLEHASDPVARWRSLNSFLGITSHFKAYNLRVMEIIPRVPSAIDDGYYSRHALKYIAYRSFQGYWR